MPERCPCCLRIIPQRRAETLRRWSLWAADYGAGMTMREVADKHGVSVAAVSKAFSLLAPKSSRRRQIQAVAHADGVG